MENQLHPRPCRSNYYVLSRQITEGEMQLKEKRCRLRGQPNQYIYRQGKVRYTAQQLNAIFVVQYVTVLSSPTKFLILQGTCKYLVRVIYAL